MAGRKEIIDKIQQNKAEIEQARIEAEIAEREGDYGKVAELRYGKIKEKKEGLKSCKETSRSAGRSASD